MKVFQDITVSRTYDIVSGGDVSLAAHRLSDSAEFKIINEEIEVLHSFSITGSGMRKIIFEKETELFHVVFNSTLYKIDKTGTIVFEDPEFFSSLGNLFVGVDYVLAPDGGYFICGTIASNGRAFISRVDASGDQLFRKVYVLDLDGLNTFTSGLIEGQEIVVAGARASGDEGDQDKLFLVKYDFDGNLVSEFVHETGVDYFSETGNNKIFGRDLIPSWNGVDYIYGVGPSLAISGTALSEVTRINLSDSALTSTELNFDRENYLAGSGGTLPGGIQSGPNRELFSVGTGMIRLQNGELFGAVNNREDQSDRQSSTTQSSFQTVFLSTARGYVFKISSNTSAPDYQWIDRNVEAQLSGVCQLDSGRILCLGFTVGFNQERKLICLSYE
ncbi:MAG: hypothetical protein AAGC47_05110 [Bacteroidota bacterium]